MIKGTRGEWRTGCLCSVTLRDGDISKAAEEEFVF